MNSYPDPMQEISEPLLVEEPAYREYRSASPQFHSLVYPTALSFPPVYPPVAGTSVPPMQAPPYPYGQVPPYPYGQVPPYLYGPAGQTPQSLTPQSMPSSPATKTSSHGWIILLGSIGLVILALGGVLIYAFAQNIPSKTTTPGSRNTSKPGVVKLGQSLTVNGLTTTLLSIESLKGDGTINPDPGSKFLVVHVQLYNGQNTSQVYNSFDFHVFNSDNQERDVEFIAPNTYTAGQQLSENDLAPNDTVTGDLIIQVPMNDHDVKLGWNPGNVTSDSAYAWNLGL